MEGLDGVVSLKITAVSRTDANLTIIHTELGKIRVEVRGHAKGGG
jgi:hypothetical protein